MNEKHPMGGNGEGANGNGNGNGAGHGSGNGAGHGAIVPRRAAVSSMSLFDEADMGAEPAHSPSAAPALSLAMLRRQLKTIIIVSVILIPLLVPPVWMFSQIEFNSTAKIKVEPVSFRILTGLEDQSIPMYDQYLNTQVAMARSPRVLERALDQPAVRKTAWYREAVSKKDGWKLLGDAPTIMEEFNNALTIMPVPRTQMFQIIAATRVPADAKVLVDAIAEQYLSLASETVNDLDKMRYEALTGSLDKQQNLIKSLIRDRSLISSLLGTDQPSEIRTFYKVQEQQRKAELTAINQQMAAIDYELSQLTKNGAASRPAAVEASPASQAAPVKTPYERDAGWYRLDEALAHARQELVIGRQHYGEGHWRIQELKASVEFAEQQKKTREEQLDRAPIAGLPAIDSEGKPRPVLRDISYLEHELGRLENEKKGIEKNITEANGKVVEANKLSQELMEKEEALKYAKDTEERLKERMNALDIEGAAPSRISIAQFGMEERTPAKDRRILMTFGMIAMAIGLGLGVGYLRGSVDPAIHEVRDLATSVRAPFLGQLPHVPNAAQVAPDSLVGKVLHESLRMVRTAMMQRMRGRSAWTVLLTSPAPAAGKTTTAILLARTLAELNKKVLLVDGDLRRRTLTKMFKLERSKGLNAVLSGDTDDQSAIVRPGDLQFDVMPAGKDGGERDTQLLACGSLTAALERWRKQYDYVLLDSPPLLSVADARILAGHSDGVIMVLRASHSRRSDAVEAYAGLSAAGGVLLGSVLIGSAHTMHDYNRYGYYAATDAESDADRTDALPV